MNDESANSIGQVLAQRAAADSFGVTFDANGWTHLLEVLGWARDTASREGTKEIEQAAAELLAKLRQVWAFDQPLPQGPQQDWANEE